jgi:hypothetical protein
MYWVYFPFGLKENVLQYRILIPAYYNVVICINGYSEFFKINNKWYRTNLFPYKKLLTYENYIQKYCKFIKGIPIPVYCYEKFNIV